MDSFKDSISDNIIYNIEALKLMKKYKNSLRELYPNLKSFSDVLSFVSKNGPSVAQENFPIVEGNRRSIGFFIKYDEYYIVSLLEESDNVLVKYKDKIFDGKVLYRDYVNGLCIIKASIKFDKEKFFRLSPKSNTECTVCSMINGIFISVKGSIEYDFKLKYLLNASVYHEGSIVIDNRGWIIGMITGDDNMCVNVYHPIKYMLENKMDIGKFQELENVKLAPLQLIREFPKELLKYKIHYIRGNDEVISGDEEIEIAHLMKLFELKTDMKIIKLKD